MKFVYQPANKDRLGDYLNESFKGDWDEFRAAIAFAKKSGTKHIAENLRHFSKTNVSEILVGIDHNGTSKEALSDLLESVQTNGYVIVVHNPIATTFHPKVYIFKSDSCAEVLIGSGNMTEGGLYTNYEASVLLKLDLTCSDDVTFLKSVEKTLDEWGDLKSGTALVLDEALIDQLVKNGYVPIEALQSDTSSTMNTKNKPNDSDDTKEKLFSGKSVPHAPKVNTTTGSALFGANPSGLANLLLSPEGAELTSNGDAGMKGFVMTLQATDVGVGQTTKGATRRSPEIFIPLGARDMNPDFWGWPEKFSEEATKFDRPNVLIKLSNHVISVNMMCWKQKSDFRLRHEELRSGGDVGDILRIELASVSSPFEYTAVIVAKGDTDFSKYEALCTEVVRAPSKKRFGYY